LQPELEMVTGKQLEVSDGFLTDQEAIGPTAQALHQLGCGAADDVGVLQGGASSVTGMVRLP
jgi:hypothetical protein